MATRKPARPSALGRKGQNRAPTARALREAITSLARRGRVSFTTHARERMELRGIDDADVFEILEYGDIDPSEGIGRGKRDGEWTCLLVARLDWAGRNAGVVTVVVGSQRLIVVTTEWMDP